MYVPTNVTILNFTAGTMKVQIKQNQYISCQTTNVCMQAGPYLIKGTGKSLSEALIFASTNPQYDDRLFIELQVQCMKIPSSNLGRTCVQKLFLTFRTIFAHNMFFPCSELGISCIELGIQ